MKDLQPALNKLVVQVFILGGAAFMMFGVWFRTEPTTTISLFTLGFLALMFAYLETIEKKLDKLLEAKK